MNRRKPVEKNQFVCIGYKCIHNLLKNKIVPSSNILKCDRYSQFILLKGVHFVKAINAIIALYVKNQNRLLKSGGAKHNVCCSSSASIGAKFPVAAVESTPMLDKWLFPNTVKNEMVPVSVCSRCCGSSRDPPSASHLNNPK